MLAGIEPDGNPHLTVYDFTVVGSGEDETPTTGGPEAQGVSYHFGAERYRQRAPPLHRLELGSFDSHRLGAPRARVPLCRRGPSPFRLVRIMNSDSTDVGRPADPELPDSLRHLFDGAADPTPLAAPDEESNGRQHRRGDGRRGRHRPHRRAGTRTRREARPASPRPLTILLGGRDLIDLRASDLVALWFTGRDGGYMEVRVLGPLAAFENGTVIDIGPRKQRTLFAALALADGPITPDRLADSVVAERRTREVGDCAVQPRLATAQRPRTGRRRRALAA